MEGLGELVQTRDGSLTLKDPVYNEEFHAIQGARFEAETLYIECGGLRQKLSEVTQDDLITVLDVGLGLGYNAIMTIEAWWSAGGPCPLRLVSLEQSAPLVKSLSEPGCSWKDDWSPLWRLCSESLRPGHAGQWSAEIDHPESGHRLSWEVLVGDAQEAALERLKIDFIWQDAFSPKKNPELWTPAWFKKLAAQSHPGTRLMTYSVARVVKDGLTAAGWNYAKLRAPGSKKEWLAAQLSTT